MSRIRCQITMSLDGFVAGPQQSLEHPLGIGGEQLHEWAFATEAFRTQHGMEGGEANVDSDVIAETTAGVGAYVMGRKMFGGVDGPWDPAWTGWWGDEPPFHTPVFVVTHHARDPLQLSGTTFTFVTDGVASAVEQARSAADGGDVMVAGGAATVQQCLAAGLLDELYLHIAPTLLGGGERLLDNLDNLVGAPLLEPVQVIGSPLVTHVKYRVLRPASSG